MWQTICLDMLSSINVPKRGDISQRSIKYCRYIDPSESCPRLNTRVLITCSGSGGQNNSVLWLIFKKLSSLLLL